MYVFCRIGWDYNPISKTLSVDDYERMRPNRRASFQMVLPRDVRDYLLRNEWDVSRADIASAIRESIKVKHQRRCTVNNLGKDKMEEMMERTGKQIMRRLLLKSSTSSALNKLELQYQAAEQAKKQAQLERQMAEDGEFEPIIETGEEKINYDDSSDDDYDDKARATTIVQP